LPQCTVPGRAGPSPHGPPQQAEFLEHGLWVFPASAATQRRAGAEQVYRGGRGAARRVTARLRALTAAVFRGRAWGRSTDEPGGPVTARFAAGGASQNARV
jgi:hypothetical protein